ncbi:hypothetical protein [Rodentibacter myodis]|uniref:Lipoprotein n=1 Tax=Rodentibacter myodis TaxID=1907939 RepID=A0A1V3JJG4_9PAST|nr:hypothetical protein [Rodentibacter myodis]OOF56774.1 hypothetical protein BKL49_10315 [Rodentibacter myodis]
MKKFSSFILFLLTGCSILGPTYTGETTADWLLKSDTEKNIKLIFRAIHTCSPDRIHTKINNVKINQNTQTVDSADETWTVSGCNTTDIFDIKYIGDGQGGTYINMTKR